MQIDSSQMHQRISPTLLSGALGLVIVPDKATIERSYSLALETMPADSQYVLREGSLPHLTLYHGKLDGLPVNEAQQILKILRLDLIDRTFVLGDLVAFGGNFIFWNVDRECDGFSALTKAHATSLSIAKYLASSSVAKAISDESLKLSEAELENVKLFGHPLVRSLYTPHITLGFHPNVIPRLPINARLEWSFKVASVEMAKIGHPGRVEEVFDLDKALDRVKR